MQNNQNLFLGIQSVKMGKRICFFYTFPVPAMECRVLEEERQALQANQGLKILENEYE